MHLGHQHLRTLLRTMQALSARENVSFGCFCPTGASCCVSSLFVLLRFLFFCVFFLLVSGLSSLRLLFTVRVVHTSHSLGSIQYAINVSCLACRSFRFQSASVLFLVSACVCLHCRIPSLITFYPPPSHSAKTLVL